MGLKRLAAIASPLDVRRCHVAHSCLDKWKLGRNLLSDLEGLTVGETVAAIDHYASAEWLRMVVRLCWACLRCRD